MVCGESYDLLVGQLEKLTSLWYMSTPPGLKEEQRPSPLSVARITALGLQVQGK